MATITGAAERLTRTLQEYNMYGRTVVLIDTDDWDRFEWVVRREIEPFMRAHPNTTSKMNEIQIGKIIFRRDLSEKFGPTAG